MKRVLINAYTKDNLGDDLFIKVLCDRYPNTEFILYAPSSYRKTFKDLKNLSIFPNDSFIVRLINSILFRIFNIKGYFLNRLSKKSDASVLIGGSLFMEVGNWQFTMKKIESMRYKDNPFFLLGANFGPYSDINFKAKHEKMFRGFTDISFRDKYSYDLFKHLGNVRVASDIIFNLKKGKMDLRKDNNVVISVIKPSVRKSLNVSDNTYYEKIRDIAVYFLKNDYKVTLMSFCEPEGDKEAIENIERLIPERYLSGISKHMYKSNIKETLDVIANSSYVVATRFHAMILGWVYNIPVYPIIYSEKMTNVINDAGFKGKYSNIETINTLKPKEVFDSMNRNVINVSDLVIDSERHFEKLDNYLSQN